MEDVFELSANDKDVELKVASQDWSKKMHEVIVCGEREALCDSFECQYNSIFDNGLNVGFEAARDLSILKGRIMFYKSVNNLDETLLNNLILEVESLELDIFRLYALSKEVSVTTRMKIPHDLSLKISTIKENVSKMLGLQNIT